jgi:hypothetical protein
VIAFDGMHGPPVVLVCGGSVDRGGAWRLASPSSTTTGAAVATAGTPPYAVEARRYIDAVISAQGGPPTALGAAWRFMPPLTEQHPKLAPGSRRSWTARPPADQVERYDELIAAGRRGEAVEYFMTQVVCLPAEFVAFARTQPFWAGQERLAHTLAYDATVMGDYSVPFDIAVAVPTPTIVMAGDASFPFMRETAAALADALPAGEVSVLAGQGHDVAPGHEAVLRRWGVWGSERSNRRQVASIRVEAIIAPRRG